MIFQRTSVLTRKILSIIFSAVILGACPAGSQAGSMSLDDKNAAIQKELDCISRAKAANKEYEWNDVCYVSEARNASGAVLSGLAGDTPYNSGSAAEYQLSLNDNDEEAVPSRNDPYSSTTVSKRESEFALFGLVENKPAEPDSYASRYGLFPDENSKPFSGGSLNVGYGLRQDDLVWNIGYPGGPNILSELTWDDVESVQIKGRGDLVFYDHFVLDGMYAYGDVYDGTNQDSDYLGDFRTYEFSRSRNDSKGDDVNDFSLGAGYRLYFDVPPKDFFFKKMQMTFLGGYSYHEQNFKMTNGYQVIPATGSFSGLDSTYKTEWDSMWLGVDLKAMRKDFTAFLRFEYHWADYYGYGNWNLRTDFAHPKSFEHFADAYGRVLSFGGDYAFTENLSFNLTFDLQDWDSEDGIDRTNYSDGSSGECPFNTANWESFAAMLGLTYYFPHKK